MAISVSAVVLFLILIYFGLTFGSWNFSEVGLSQEVFVWRFTIWRSKAYLALPRWEDKSEMPFTLLEVPWPEVGYPLQIVGSSTLSGVVPFPNAKYQEEGNCRNLQSVTGLDSDPRGRLWVLDAPTKNKKCQPKIVLFDLRRGEKVTETNLRGVSPRNLRCLVLDPDLGQITGRAYVSDPGDESIIVYSLTRRSWWRLKLSKESNVPRVFTTDLAVSRKNSLMYLTGYQTDDLFAIDLEGVRNIEDSLSPMKNDSLLRTPVSWVGSKLGTSSGLACDFRGGLHYFMVTELASVRWDSRYKLEAENHAILYQSEAVPAVTDFAFDGQKNLWAIVNERHPLLTAKNFHRKNNKGPGSIERRTIRVYKFNPFAL